MYLGCSTLYFCTFFLEWSCHVDSGELCKVQRVRRGLDERRCFPFFRFSSSVDIGGGLVVVCMTSFTSMFGVTSYVRLLNCYMGHQHSHSFFLSDVLPFTSLYQVRMIFWSGEHSFSRHKEQKVGGFHLSCDKVCKDNLPGKVLKFLKWFRKCKCISLVLWEAQFSAKNFFWDKSAKLTILQWVALWKSAFRKAGLFIYNAISIYKQ